MNNRGSVAYE